jgi:hypothetical protein
MGALEPSPVATGLSAAVSSFLMGGLVLGSVLELVDLVAELGILGRNPGLAWAGLLGCGRALAKFSMAVLVFRVLTGVYVF